MAVGWKERIAAELQKINPSPLLPLTTAISSVEFFPFPHVYFLSFVCLLPIENIQWGKVVSKMYRNSSIFSSFLLTFLSWFSFLLLEKKKEKKVNVRRKDGPGA